MPVIAKKSGTDFTPCPAGVHQAVCVDVVDMGLIESVFNGKPKKQHKVRIVWQVEELRDEDHTPFLVQKRYTLSLDDRANLRKDLESWRGRAFTDQELEGFDLEVLIGVNCLLAVQHTNRNGTVYADVTAVMPLKKGMAKLSPVGYTRVKDRENQPEPSPSSDSDDPFGDMDAVPFAWALPLLVPATAAAHAFLSGGWV